MAVGLWVIFLVVLAWRLEPVAVRHYENYLNRHLIEADRRLDVDDREGAAAALREHLMLNPEDGKTQVRLGLLVADLGDAAAALRIWKRALDSNAADRAIHAMYFHYLNQVEHINDLLTACQAKSQFERCTELMATYAEALHESLGHVITSEGLDPFLHSMLINEVHEGLSVIAHARWEVGGEASLDAFIHGFADMSMYLSLMTDEVNGYRIGEGVRKIVTDRIIEEASGAFSDKEWLESARLYEVAARQLGQITESSMAWFAAVMRTESVYNQAAALNNAERFTRAKEVMLAYQEECASHPPHLSCGDLSKWEAQIADFGQRAQKFRTYAQYDELTRLANEAFEQNDWTVAIARYRQVIKHLDGPNAHAFSDFARGQALYNIAMAQWNDRRRTDAYLTLVNLRNTYSEYNPELVAEQLTIMKPK